MLMLFTKQSLHGDHTSPQNLLRKTVLCVNLYIYIYILLTNQQQQQQQQQQQ